MAKSIQKKVTFPPAGRYVVAVSGGVDSVVLLDLLAKRKNYELIVAHFDHGIRKDSAADRKFVASLAAKLGLKFEYQAGKLGPKATEDQARKARYRFLQKVQAKHRTQAIITAHHLDDALETAIFNAGRGATELGLTPLHLNDQLIRPLLGLNKADLLLYARQNKLNWQDDSTNQDLTIARNFIRHKVLPTFSKSRIAKTLGNQVATNRQTQARLESELLTNAKILADRTEFNRHYLIMLENSQLQELFSYLLAKRSAGIERAQAKRLVHFAKTAQPKTELKLGVGVKAVCSSESLQLIYSA